VGALRDEQAKFLELVKLIGGSHFGILLKYGTH